MTAGCTFAWMDQQPLPAFGAIVTDRVGFAAAVGLDESDLAAGLPVQSISCGVPFLFAPIASRRAVDSVAIDRRALAKSCASAGVPELPVFFFTTESASGPREESESSSAAARARGVGPHAHEDETLYSRMLAPGFGIAEDPATGSASGPVGCYLVQHLVVGPDAAQSMVSLQGVAMSGPAGSPFRSRAARAPSRAFASVDAQSSSGTASCASESSEVSKPAWSG